MDVKCVPSPLHPLFHHLSCFRAPAPTLEVLRVSDCPPKILLLLHVPPLPPPLCLEQLLSTRLRCSESPPGGFPLPRAGEVARQTQIHCTEAV